MDGVKPSAVPTAASSGTKRKRNEPKFYAVRVGRAPGVYHSWADCFEQIKGYKNSLFKSFLSLTDAEAFLRDENSGSSSPSSKNPQKFYAVANGRIPGVYTDWLSAQKQITGWTKPKHKSFATRAEAEAFIAANAGDATGTPAPNAAIDPDGTPTSQSKTASKGNLSPATKKRRKGSDAARNGVVNNQELPDPGTGSLPPDAEDGFDPNIKLNPATGKLEFRTATEKSSMKLQATGESKGGYLKIYTDGSSLGNGQKGSTAGVGVFFGPDDNRNVSEPLAGVRQTNQRAELTAIQRALDIAPLDRRVEIFTDSNYAINCVTKWFQAWRNNGWQTSAKKPVENRDLVEAIVNKIEQRERFGSHATKFTWVKGHNDDPGNVAADHLAVNGALVARAEMG